MSVGTVLAVPAYQGFPFAFVPTGALLGFYSLCGERKMAWFESWFDDVQGITVETVCLLHLQPFSFHLFTVCISLWDDILSLNTHFKLCRI